MLEIILWVPFRHRHFSMFQQLFITYTFIIWESSKLKMSKKPTH